MRSELEESRQKLEEDRRSLRQKVQQLEDEKQKLGQDRESLNKEVQQKLITGEQWLKDKLNEELRVKWENENRQLSESFDARLQNQIGEKKRMCEEHIKELELNYQHQIKLLQQQSSRLKQEAEQLKHEAQRQL